MFSGATLIGSCSAIMRSSLKTIDRLSISTAPARRSQVEWRVGVFSVLTIRRPEANREGRTVKVGSSVFERALSLACRGSPSPRVQTIIGVEHREPIEAVGRDVIPQVAGL